MGLDVDDAGDWRDLAGQLTPEQVAEFERTEQSWERMTQSRSPYLRNASSSGDDRRRELLSKARLTAKENSLALIAAPPEASEVQPWDERHQDDGVWFRDFIVPAWPVDWVQVVIAGRQYDDGRCERAIGLTSNYAYLDDHYPGWWRDGGPSLANSPLTQAQAGTLADALRKAAGRLEELTHVGVPSAAPQAVPRRWRTGERQSVVGAEISIESWQDPAGRYAPRIWLNPGTDPGWTPAQARELATALDEAAGADAEPAAQAAPAAEAAPPPPVAEGTQAAPVSPSTGVVAQLRGGSAGWRALSIALAVTALAQFGLLWQGVSRWNRGVAGWGFIAVALAGLALLFVGERRPTRALSVWGLIMLFGGAIIDLVLTWVSPS